MEINNMKKKLILAGVFLLALVLCINILHILSTATISVRTDVPDGFIKVEEMAQSGQKGALFSKQKRSHINVRVKPGVYQVTAYGQGGYFAASTTKLIRVKARDRVNLTLNPLTANNPEPVYGNVAQDLRADNSSLSFLDTQNAQSGSLLKVSSNGNIAHLFPEHTNLTSIRWINHRRAVTQDSAGNLYLVDGNSINLLSLPFDLVAGAPKPAYDVAANGSIYVSNGQAVYESADGVSYKRILAISGQVTSLSAGSGAVAVLTKSGSVDKLVVVTDTGHQRSKSISAEHASWSPDFKHILIRQDTADVVLDSSLNETASFLIQGSDNLVWKDKDSLYYSVDSQLWQLKLSSKYSNKLGSLPSGQSITQIYPDAAGSYVYFQTNNGEKQQLYRLSLKNKPVSSAVNQLDVFLPLTLDGCYVSYLNFGRVRILLTPFNDYQTDACLASIKTRLARYGLNVGWYSFDVLPVATVSGD